MTSVLTIDQLKEGMEVAIPVKNKVGQILLPANLILENKHIRMLHTWGISTISVVSNLDEPGNSKYDAGQIENARNELNKRILWKPELPFEEELYEMGLFIILERK